ncbi:glucosaminidase domain-containing protein [Coprobacter tertius]|uniref:Peptidoglycan hydrolase n=1 Tax=Coprobacter tertius TaxID=2944915 RepID=A0ABT1MKX0_9BACT|nr:glucosaminidase domain-containing protein [Coprobacter tertius]MCP9612353.1 glucosaminidase domain-containing protein [Coprobacter tertius]
MNKTTFRQVISCPKSLPLLITLFLVSFCISVTAQNKNRIYMRYIDQYKDLAIEQQRKYKIPASITLSQGLLESGAGLGQLASKSNNHFGIKCHKWTGARVYHDDDAKGECFRKYRHPKESYEDHSLFLTRNMRYARLFELKSTDYKGWARGLQQCGYATDKAYASKLIQLIELYELYQYDRKGSRDKIPNTTQQIVIRRPVYKSYGLLYVEARDGDSMASLAKELGFKKKKLCSYNEIPEEYPLEAGDIIYLEKKNKKAEKPYLFHKVRAGESMHDISQRYGIRVKNLYKMNKKDSEYVPSEGDTLKLR